MFYDNKCAKCGEIAKWKCSKCQNINPITYIECINCKHGKDNCNCEPERWSWKDNN